MSGSVDGAPRGVSGYSLGGLASLLATALDASIGAAVDLDPNDDLASPWYAALGSIEVPVARLGRLGSMMPSPIQRSVSNLAARAQAAAIGVAVVSGGCSHCEYALQVVLAPAADRSAAGCTGCPDVDGLEAPTCESLGSQGRLCRYGTHGYEDDPRDHFATLTVVR